MTKSIYSFGKEIAEAYRENIELLTNFEKEILKAREEVTDILTNLEKVNKMFGLQPLNRQDKDTEQCVECEQKENRHANNCLRYS